MDEQIGDDQKRYVVGQLEAALLQGLDSGEPIEVDDEWWSRKLAELTARVADEGNPK
jgi:antitoxin ParD1/3/4